MRLILNSHKDIHCFDEWKSYNAVLENKYDNPKNAQIVGLKMPNWTEWVVQSEYYRSFYNNDPIIFMLRDVRATIASMLTLPTGNVNFFNNVLEAVNIKWPNDEHRTFSKIYTDEVKQIEKMDFPDFRKAALFWRVKTSCYLDMVKLGFRVLPVNYDLFVLNPTSHLRIITNFLGIEWDDGLLLHHTKQHDETFDGIAVGNTMVNRPIDSKSITKWKDILKDEETAILETAGYWNDYVITL